TYWPGRKVNGSFSLVASSPLCSLPFRGGNGVAWADMGRVTQGGWSGKVAGTVVALLGGRPCGRNIDSRPRGRKRWIGKGAKRPYSLAGAASTGVEPGEPKSRPLSPR